MYVLLNMETVLMKPVPKMNRNHHGQLCRKYFRLWNFWIFVFCSNILVSTSAFSYFDNYKIINSRKDQFFLQFSILFHLNILLSCPTGEITKAIETNKKQLRINCTLVFNSLSVTYSVNFKFYVVSWDAKLYEVKCQIS